jgi:hypothetical protein
MSIFEDDSLTQGQRLVWFALKEMAVSKTAPNNCSKIAEHMDSARSFVSRALQTLNRLGWISRESEMIHIHDSPCVRDSDTQDRDSQSRNRDSESRDSQSRKGFPFPPLVSFQERISFNLPSQPTLSSSQENGESDDSPPWLQRLLDEISWQAKPLPDDHPARWEYHPGEWQWEAAMYLLRGLQEHQVLHSGIDDSKPEGQIASEWADVVRRLHEKDGYGRPVIRGTLWWLINTENWWIQNVIQSGSNYALRSRDGDGAHKFDKLVQRARRYYEQRQKQRADPDAIREGFAPESEQEPEPAGSSGDSIPDERGVEVSGFQW